MSAPLVLVLQHIACEPPATYGDVLRERGIGLHRVEVYRGDPLPDLRSYGAVLVMGGPMSANDDDRYPWLTAEKRLIARAASAGTPVWGVCLGAQLLAAALGARVYAGLRPEVGMGTVQLAEHAADDPVFDGLPRSFDAFQWHGDTFDLPPGARWLATSAPYRHQAFSWGASYGLQFHLEVTPDLAAQWADVPAYVRALESVHGPGALPTVIEDLRRRAADSEALARTVLGRWLARYVLLDREVA